MAKWAITYNGFGSAGSTETHHDWTHVNVQSLKSTPVMSDDGISIETTKHSMVGTALISKATDAHFRLAILNARERLGAHPRKGADTAVKIYLDSAVADTDVASGISSSTQTDGLQGLAGEYSGGSEHNVVTYYGMDEDDYGLPTCDFSIEEVVGTMTAVVSFTISWHKYEPPAAGLTYDVLSHTWTQEYTIDEAGMTTLVVDGQLRTRNYVDGRNSLSTTARGTNPDMWRTLVMPAVPDNFRVESMRWATDTTGSKLLYRISLKEYARPLPFPAKRGTGSFVYKRAVGDGFSLMGTKVFTGELEGDTNTDPRELLNSLIRIASSRIIFGGPATPGGPNEPKSTPDRIMSITVGEEDIFTKKKIKLQIIAQGMQTTSPWGTVEAEGQGQGFNLLDPFFNHEELSLAERPNAYGSQMIASVKRQLFLPWDPDTNAAWENERAFPQATWRPANEWAGDDVALVADDEIISDATAEATDGEHINAPIDETGQSKNPYAMVSGSEHVNVDNSIIVLSCQSLTAYDVPFQMGKPKVTIVSEYQFSRVGLPPKRIFISKPTNGIVLEEDFSVNRGDIDANNNRTYLGSYRRVVQLLDNNDGLGDFYHADINLPGWGTVQMRAWWPKDNVLTMPADPRVEGGVDSTTGSITRTLFSGEGLDDQSSQKYTLGAATKLYGTDNDSTP